MSAVHEGWTAARLPPIGLGVANMSDEQVEVAVHAALESGYRMIDTAAAYRNEGAVGRALATSGIPRADVVVATKIWVVDSRPVGEIVDMVRHSVDELALDDGVDLCLIHWPGRDGGHVAAWEGLLAAQSLGLTRLVGVSNFLPRHLEDLADAGLPSPAVNQIERHPFHSQESLRLANGTRGIRTVAWSPLGKGRLVGDPTITDIARRTGRTPGQIALRWNLERGVIVIPKSASPARIAENAQVFDFVLAAEDVALIDALDEGASANAPLYGLYQ